MDDMYRALLELEAEERTRVGPEVVRPEVGAHMLSISRSHMYTLLAQNRIASIRIGNCRRVPVKAIRRFIEEMEEAEKARREGGEHA